MRLLLAKESCPRCSRSASLCHDSTANRGAIASARRRFVNTTLMFLLTVLGAALAAGAAGVPTSSLHSSLPWQLPADELTPCTLPGLQALGYAINQLVHASGAAQGWRIPFAAAAWCPLTMLLLMLFVLPGER